jgi:hypothetical protein
MQNHLGTNRIDPSHPGTTTPQLESPRYTQEKMTTSPDSHQSMNMNIHDRNLRLLRGGIQRQIGEHVPHPDMSHMDKNLLRSDMSHMDENNLRPVIDPTEIICNPTMNNSRQAPLATHLASSPFVARRRSPFAINLNRRKPFVAKRRPIAGFRRTYLRVGRRLTKNPLARMRTRKKRRSLGLPAEIPVRNRKQTGQRSSGEEVDQKREARVLGVLSENISRGGSRISQPNLIADRPKFPQPLTSEPLNPGSNHQQEGHRTGKQVQHQARRKILGMSFPIIPRNTMAAEQRKRVTPMQRSDGRQVQHEDAPRPDHQLRSTERDRQLPLGALQSSAEDQQRWKRWQQASESQSRASHVALMPASQRYLDPGLLLDAGTRSTISRDHLRL